MAATIKRVMWKSASSARAGLRALSLSQHEIKTSMDRRALAVPVKGKKDWICWIKRDWDL